MKGLDVNDYEWDEISDTDNYKHFRNTIKSGDLLVWNESNDAFINLLLRIVRLFTMSEYSHVGVAVWVRDRLYVVEAVIPEVRLALVSHKDEFFHLNANIEWEDHYGEILCEHVGKKYSIIDAIRGYFGFTSKSNDRWQCAELATVFYRSIGIELGATYTPSKLVSSFLVQRQSRITYIKSTNSID